MDLKSTLNAAQSGAEVHERKASQAVGALQSERDTLQQDTHRISQTLTADKDKIAMEKAALAAEVDRLTGKLKSLKDTKSENERLKQFSEIQSSELTQLRETKQKFTSIIQKQDTLVKSVELEKDRLERRVKSLKKSMTKLQDDVASTEAARQENAEPKAQVTQLHALIDRQQLVLRKDRHAFFDEEDSTLSIGRQTASLGNVKKPGLKNEASDSDNDTSYGTPVEGSENEQDKSSPKTRKSGPLLAAKRDQKLKGDVEQDSWFAMLDKRQRDLSERNQGGSITLSDYDGEDDEGDVASDNSVVAQKCQNYLQERKSATQQNQERSKSGSTSMRYEPGAASKPFAFREGVPRRPTKSRWKTKEECQKKAVGHLRNIYTPPVKVEANVAAAAVRAHIPARPDPRLDPPVVGPIRKSRDRI